MTFKEQLQQLKDTFTPKTTALEKAQFVYQFIETMILSEREEVNLSNQLQTQLADLRTQLIKTKINKLKEKGYKCDGSLNDFIKMLTDSKNDNERMLDNANYYKSIIGLDKEKLVNLYESFFGNI